MIDIKDLREKPDFYQESAANKGVQIDVKKITDLDEKKRELQASIEALTAKKNEASKKIASTDGEERAAIIEEMQKIKDEEQSLKEQIDPIVSELEELLHKIPNPALSDVKVSPNEEDNEVLRHVGEKPEFSFEVKDHEDLAVDLGILDKERAGKVSGARFVYLKGDAVRLQLALQNYVLSIVEKYGFTPVIVPHIVNSESMRAMGYLEHGGTDEIYYLEKDDQYLIGTSEQAIGPMHSGEILDIEDGKPLRYVGISPCYRREAGSYGKDTKGIIRVHQFDKIEMFSFTTPNDSEAEHELILSIEEEIMQGLGLHYQVIKMVTGDLGLPAARKYDIETWVPSQNTYRETHSCSTTTDFQTRRLNTRFRNSEGKPEFAHALNGTASAMGRMLVAIIENYQNEDGTVTVPEALRQYIGKDIIG